MDMLFSYKHVIDVLLISTVADDFRNYDYGITENYKRYKQKTPPSYDLKKITVPIILFYSENDMVTPKEVTVLRLAFHCLICPRKESKRKIVTHDEIVIL